MLAHQLRPVLAGLVLSLWLTGILGCGNVSGNGASEKVEKVHQEAITFPENWVVLHPSATGPVIYARGGVPVQSMRVTADSIQSINRLSESISWLITSYEKKSETKHSFELGRNPMHNTFARYEWEYLNTGKLAIIDWEVIRSSNNDEQVIGYGHMLAIPEVQASNFTWTEVPKDRPVSLPSFTSENLDSLRQAQN